MKQSFIGLYLKISNSYYDPSYKNHKQLEYPVTTLTNINKVHGGIGIKNSGDVLILQLKNCYPEYHTAEDHKRII
jgi:hypothetical protein